MLPRSLKGFSVFVNGNDFAGIIVEGNLPKLVRKMEEYWSGGMTGALDIDLGHEKLETELTIGEFNELVFNDWGTCDAVGTKLRLMASLERDDSGCQVTPFEIVMHGRWAELEGGMKMGDLTEFTNKFSIGYLKITSDGTELIEIDVAKNILKSGGIDRTAARRAAIGQTY